MNHTLLVAWDMFNKYEQRAIIKWVTQCVPNIKPGEVPFQSLSLVFQVLDAMDSQMVHQYGPSHFTAPRRFKQMILNAVHNQELQ